MLRSAVEQYGRAQSGLLFCCNYSNQTYFYLEMNVGLEIVKSNCCGEELCDISIRSYWQNTLWESLVLFNDTRSNTVGF